MNLRYLTSAIAAIGISLSGWSATPLPYHNTCDDINTVTALSESNQAAYKWKTAALQGNSVFQCKQGSIDLVRQIHATIWTPALEIETGKTYRVSVVVGTAITVEKSKVTIGMYASPSADAANTKILETGPLPAFSATARPETIEQIFVGDASKPYISITNSGGGYINFFNVDDIIVEEFVGVQPPKEVENLRATAEGKTVEISFRLPSEDLTGSPLESISSVMLQRNGNEIATWKDAQPGTDITFTDRLSSAGQYTYTVTCAVEDMSSNTVVNLNIPVNPTPTYPRDYEKDEEGNYIGKNYLAPAVYIPGEGVKLSWRPAEEGTLYTVTRIFDNKVIASDITETEITDADIDPTKAEVYQYQIKTKSGRLTTVLYTSSPLSLHNTLPFDPYTGSGAVNDFTVVDADCDSSTWTSLSGNAALHGASTYFANPRNGDDWLITPGIEMEAGKSYRIDVDALCASIAESNVMLRVTAGYTNTVAGMTEELIPAFVFSHLTPRTYSCYFTPETSGNVFFGFEAIDPNGEHRFNDMGISRILIREVPGETPATISDLRVDYGAAPGNASLVFTAPAKDVAGNNVASLAKIEIMNEGDVIATIADPNPGQRYTQEISFTPGVKTRFSVTAYTSEPGMPAEIDVMLLTAPYTQTFDTEESMEGYKVTDVGLDGYTWIYYPALQAVRNFAMSNCTHNDYLFTPAIHLEAGNYYKIDFTSWLEREDTDYSYDNNIEVLIGTEPEIEALTETVVAPFTVRGAKANSVLLKNWFTVPATGVYYLAWHAFSEQYLARELFVDDIHISDKIPDRYPAGVDNFAIAPDPEGALKATISFDLPTKDLAGRELTTNFHGYKIYCDGFEIANGAGEPGKHVDYTHQTSNGVHLFTVRCFGAENEPTVDIEDVAYVGINRPGAVEFVEVDENPEKYGEVTITWGLPVGDIDGFPLNTTNITYTVGQYYYNPNTGESQEIEYANNLKTLSYTKTVKSNAEEQEFMRFFVRANTTAGKGNPTVLTKYTAVGKPFDLPFTESFPMGNPSHIMMQERPFEGKYASWGYNTSNPVTGVQPVDGDRGLALMEVIESESGARLFTLRVNLNKANPVLTFYVYNQSNAQRTDNNLLGISLREGNGDFVTVASKSVDEWAAGNPGWQKCSVDLSEYAGKVVYIGLDGIAKNLTFIHVDNIRIDSPVDIDVAAMGVSHPKVYVGVDHEVSVNLRNLGSKDATDVTVSLTLDGEPFESRTIDRVGAGEDVAVTFTNRFTRADIGNHTYAASMKCDGDGDALNNTTTGKPFYLSDNEYPTVINLEAASSDDTVTLSWQEPALPEEPTEITDDFESYPSWATMHTGGIGDYTLIDADGCQIGGFADHDLPNIAFGSKQSYTLWDFTDPYFAYDQTVSDRYKAHSGDKCLVSIYAPGQDSWTEDRIISPLLPGTAQTISFYAKALEDARPEIFQVYYSFDGTNLNDYFNNRFARQTVGGEWTKFSYDLPEGTRYFVIEHYSSAYTGGYFFFLDDLTYTPIGDETLVTEGYNVYRNNELLTESPVTALSWTDLTPLKNNNTYGVTAVYDRGESPVVETEITTLGVSGIVSGVKVYGENGHIVINGAEGLDFAVSSVSGMTLTTRRADSDTVRIPVQPGIYIVNVGGATFKLLLN